VRQWRQSGLSTPRGHWILAPGFLFLVVARFVLGLGIGGNYRVTAVLMSDYANRKDRGRLVFVGSPCRIWA
jgi:MFS family permease